MVKRGAFKSERIPNRTSCRNHSMKSSLIRMRRHSESIGIPTPNDKTRSENRTSMMPNCVNRRHERGIYDHCPPVAWTREALTIEPDKDQRSSYKELLQPPPIVGNKNRYRMVYSCEFESFRDMMTIMSTCQADGSLRTRCRIENVF
jgi:hypothetical protein